MDFYVKNVPEPRKSILKKFVGLKNIPSISSKSNIARRVNAKKGDILVMERVGLDLDYGLKTKQYKYLAKKLLKVI